MVRHGSVGRFFEEIAMYSNKIAKSLLLKPSIGVRSYFSISVCKMRAYSIPVLAGMHY